MTEIMHPDMENEYPVALSELELNAVSGGTGGESRMTCRVCGATTSDPAKMKKWQLGISNHDGVIMSLCERCKKNSLRVESVRHEE